MDEHRMNPETAPIPIGRGRAGMTVTELNRLIIRALRAEPAIQDVTVTAEISGFRPYVTSGHWYFSLKDAQCSIPCVMYRQNNLRGAAVRPKDGDSVTVTGYVNLYDRDGRLQLYVMTMKPAGLGSLYERFEALKRALSAEGLFDAARKRPLPMVPRRVAVITSANGAALHDILNVSGMRSPWIPIVLVPSGVQGPQAAGELREAMVRAGRLPGVDVIIIGRGGGSMEDLWCFNDEELARAIAASPVPVVSGVGHEVDTTICDFVADVRASTPSNAAEIVFPDRKELRQRTALLEAALNRAMTDTLNRQLLRVKEARQELTRFSPERLVRDRLERVHRARHQLQAALLMQLEAERLRTVRARLSLHHGMAQRLALSGTRVEALRPALNQGMARTLSLREKDLAGLRDRLRAISPLGILDRGYVLVYDDRGAEVIPRAAEARRRPEMRLRFADGTVHVIRKEGSGEHE